MEQSRVLAALSALANETRLDLMRGLIQRGPDGMAAGEIAQRLGVSASRLSFHLGALEQAGLLTSRRVARNVIYAVDHKAIGAVIGFLLNDCCKAHPEVCACCQPQSANCAGPAPQSPGTAKI